MDYLARKICLCDYSHSSGITVQVKDGKSYCPRCGGEITPYLAKAEKIMPAWRSVSVDIDDAERSYGFNEALDLCLPIVADLLKRVDELSHSAQFRRVEAQQKKIAELEADFAHRGNIILELEEEKKGWSIEKIATDRDTYKAKAERYEKALNGAYHAIRSEESIVGKLGYHIKRAYEIIEQALGGKQA